jgi:catechol 2,3-dioxygenase-like lactoylglutathione lyase family enzyme
MKMKGLDRVTILVKDMDKAAQFFSQKLGIVFTELPGAETMGMRASISLDYQMELISPVLPLPEAAPLHLKRWAKLLEHRENVLIALSFRVQDADKTAAEAEQEGMRIEMRFDLPETPPWSICYLKELIMEEEDTLGIPISFVEYERM